MPILALNRASPISDLENLALPEIVYYGDLWERAQKNDRTELDKLRRKTG